MTQQRSDGAPSADAANAYLEALRERLAADGCGMTATTWPDYRGRPAATARRLPSRQTTSRIWTVVTEASSAPDSVRTTSSTVVHDVRPVSSAAAIG